MIEWQQDNVGLEKAVQRPFKRLPSIFDTFNSN